MNSSDAKYPKGCSITLWVAILLFTLFVFIPYADFYVGLGRISLKADIPPDVSVLENYLATEAFIPGMSQDEVHNLLYSLGVRVKIEDISNVHKRLYPEETGLYESVTLWIGYWPLNRYDLTFIYDEKYVLTSVTFHNDPS